MNCTCFDLFQGGAGYSCRSYKPPLLRLMEVVGVIELLGALGSLKTRLEILLRICHTETGNETVLPSLTGGRNE